MCDTNLTPPKALRVLEEALVYDQGLTIADLNTNIKEERWADLNLDGLNPLPSQAVDAVKRSTAMPNFEKDLVVHFQSASKAAIQRMSVDLTEEARDSTRTASRQYD